MSAFDLIVLEHRDAKYGADATNFGCGNRSGRVDIGCVREMIVTCTGSRSTRRPARCRGVNGFARIDSHRHAMKCSHAQIVLASLARAECSHRKAQRFFSMASNTGCSSPGELE